ncbi:MAG: helix-turn-helix transcriptional regulator [Burkholderiales bacterium]
MSNIKLVSKKELRSVYGIPYSFQHIARLEHQGQFPKRLRLGACRVAWVVEEVESWIAVRIAQR